MANMYNYKKPANYHALKQTVKPAEPVAIAPKQPKNSQDSYLEQKVLTARPEELTLMLYDGIIKFLKQGQLFIEQNDVEKANNSIIRAQDILDELLATLNMDIEISGNLQALYVFMRARLVEANIRKDSAMIDEVIELATDLRDTWKEAMGLARLVSAPSTGE